MSCTISKIDNLTQEILTGPAFNLLKGTCKSFVELEYHFKECYKVVTDRLDWKNPEGHEYPFDLSKPLPLTEERGRQVIPAGYFFNNDLKYLKVKVAYDKHVVWGISHWGPKRQNFYGYASNRESRHDVFFTKRIIAVTHVKVMKWYDYGYLEEIIVQREDQTLHKFKEGDFPRLNLHDIEDMLLLLVQKKLSNLEKDVIFDLNVALRMFTRCIVILKWVEDLQLGVESYQKKLNLTKPETYRSDISNMTPYTAYKNPQGIIYLDKLDQTSILQFASLLKGESKRKGLNFCTLITQAGNGADVVVPLESIHVVSESSIDGLDSMLENGSWFIRNNPLILKKWNPEGNLMKEEVVNVPVWVKLHGVPITAFTEDGLSAIATKIDLKDTIVVVMPKLTGVGFYTCTVHVEYEWKPPKCECWKVFGHIQEECHKNPFMGVAKNLKKLMRILF
ncbi:uncharacterized mitochondrial protein-like protein [Tanacetum coccineum]|uniref:Uncharacterized mitochondrial protein-like protein n=1 Tax=Tanacetum coccineum TaxID=301880 RepID=A0ABQ4Y0X6_9ASTR